MRYYRARSRGSGSCTRSTGPSRMRDGGRRSWRNGSPNWATRAVGSWRACCRTQRYGKDQAQRVLALLGTYARSDLITALERAVRYGAYSHAAVERILSSQARPKTILETLAAEEWKQIPPWLGEDLISPRPTSVYQYLCESEPPNHENPNTAEAASGADETSPEDTACADGAMPEDP